MLPDLPTPDELDALIAEAYADAPEGPGRAEGLAEAEAFEALARAWDTATRGLLASLLRSAAAGGIDADDSGAVSPDELRAFAERLVNTAAALLAAAAGTNVALALGPFLAAILGAQTTAALEAVPDLDAASLLVLGGPDTRAARWLERHEAFWVTRYGERRLEPRIARLLAENAEAAGGDAGAARRLLAGLASEYERGLAYWRLVAVAAVHRSGTLGRVAALEAAGLDGIYDATVDGRTTEVCRFLDGKRVPLASLTRWRDDMLAADTPDAAASVGRWWREAEVPELRRLVAAQGGAVPPSAVAPNHAHCRSIITAAPRGAAPR